MPLEGEQFTTVQVDQLERVRERPYAPRAVAGLAVLDDPVAKPRLKAKIGTGQLNRITASEKCRVDLSHVVPASRRDQQDLRCDEADSLFQRPKERVYRFMRMPAGQSGL